MTKGMHSFMFEKESLQTKVYFHTVNVPLRSIRNGFNGEVGFAHAAGI